jgi:hypothetical protein
MYLIFWIMFLLYHLAFKHALYRFFIRCLNNEFAIFAVVIYYQLTFFVLFYLFSNQKQFQNRMDIYLYLLL